MKDLIIVGAGGLGREMLFQLREINKISPAYHILGFADDSRTGESIHGLPVFCDTASLSARTADTAVVIAVGKPQARRHIFGRLQGNAHLSFPTVIAPGVVCSDSVQIGKGCIIGFGATLTVDIRLGDFVLVSNGCNIGHDAVLDDFATLYPGVHISGNVHAGAGCEIGVGSNIIQGLSIGANAVLGAGCAVIRDIPADCTAVGVPAKVIRTHVHPI